ncbi:type IVB secretion system protein IcmX [Legionella feeleii]|uniref:IcmX (IcmY) n=1 Tax=Legionella feeleii TaxID=453 RepID=A0A0W0THF9_9GAMM|nr:type IVB secretion system protein IcmX [Legionella feeleii]KTC95028.1 IcmX (IcmY) [Legionella feeleii]SPX61754.1 IcmX (IcmY) [Legionella feeleii]STX39397.1 IcmX (IcmY) [Legionella feeleii]
MMKLISRVLPGLLLAATTSTYASSTDSDSLSEIATYLLNLGQYLGYNVNVSPSDPNNNPPVTVSQTLLNESGLQASYVVLYDTFLAAIPVNSANQNPVLLLANNFPGAGTINTFANLIYAAYSSVDSATQPSVSRLIDQQTYQNDPVSQAVLNILGTPDYSYCLKNDNVTVINPCNYPSTVFNQNQVMANVLGGTPGAIGDSSGIPDPETFFSYDYNQPFISQLNANSLMGPLVYSTTNSDSASTSSGEGNTQNQGLTATNQVQQAANFIRYATGAVAPASLPNYSQYSSLFSQAQVPQNTTPNLQQLQAQSALSSYLMNLRIYAAQTSVGISNLYYILGKRIQQTPPTATGGSNTAPTSQALTEFNMATWRLYNPDQSVNTMWTAQISNASAATVQKEIATLLAEINYQLYLSRVQQERILLTNTMLLIQNARAAQPSSSLSTSGSSTSATDN